MRATDQHYQQVKPPKIHSMKNYRRVPTKSLLRRLRIAQYELPTPFVDGFPDPEEFYILLQQHAGKPAVPVVKAGAAVRKDELLADIPENSLGARIHAPLDGVVAEVTAEHICIAVDAEAKAEGKSV